MELIHWLDKPLCVFLLSTRQLKLNCVLSLASWKSLNQALSKCNSNCDVSNRKGIYHTRCSPMHIISIVCYESQSATRVMVTFSEREEQGAERGKGREDLCRKRHILAADAERRWRIAGRGFDPVSLLLSRGDCNWWERQMAQLSS